MQYFCQACNMLFEISGTIKFFIKNQHYVIAKMLITSKVQGV